MKYTVWTYRNGEAHPVNLPAHLPASAPRTLPEWRAAADRLLANEKLGLQWVEVRRDSPRGEIAVYHTEALSNSEEEERKK